MFCNINKIYILAYKIHLFFITVQKYTTKSTIDFKIFSPDQKIFNLEGNVKLNERNAFY